MQLKNNFAEETRELFIFNTECFWCGKQHANCMHHILGRCSNSPLNCAPLNNFECHIGNGLLATESCKSKLLKKTLQYLLKNSYILTTEDKKFKKQYAKYYK